jgi:hypothetical protein
LEEDGGFILLAGFDGLLIEAPVLFDLFVSRAADSIRGLFVAAVLILFVRGISRGGTECCCRFAC